MRSIGLSAYDLFQDPDFAPDKVKVPWWSKPFAKMMSSRVKPQTDERDQRDYANYDMQIDHALDRIEDVRKKKKEPADRKGAPCDTVRLFFKRKEKK